MNKKLSIWLVIIGILFLAIDIQIPMGAAYPKMLKAKELGDVFQGNVINYFIGTRPAIDIFSDLIGFALVFIGSCFLVKKSWKFAAAMLLTPIASVLYITIPQLPYHLTGGNLYLKAAEYNFLVVLIEILVEYFVIHGIVKMTSCVQNNWHNNEMLAGWIIAMMSKGLLVMIVFFFGHNTFFYIYSLIMIGATIFYINRLLKTLEFKPE